MLMRPQHAALLWALLLAANVPACGDEQSKDDPSLGEEESSSSGSDDEDAADDEAGQAGTGDKPTNSKPAAGAGAKPASDGAKPGNTGNSKPDAGGSLEPAKDDGKKDATKPGKAGACCDEDEDDCICRGDEPTLESLKKEGPYQVKDYNAGFAVDMMYGGARIWYPDDEAAKPPYSGVVLCPGFTGTIADLAEWGPFLASHGIVTMIIDTTTVLDPVASRVGQLWAALNALKKEDERADSPLAGKLSDDRYGLGGWSMGGGATWINTGDHAELKTGMTLAGHSSTAGGATIASKITVPTLMFAGSADPEFLGGAKQSQGAYMAIPADTPKIMYEAMGMGHWEFNAPKGNSWNTGAYGLAFQKTFLDGDQRYRKFLLEQGPNASEWLSNIE